MEIKKKTWPELFKSIEEGKKTAEVRLADFDLNEGDIIVFEEYNPETKEYTGKSIKKTVKNLVKVDLLKFYSAEDLQKGVYLMSLE